MSEEKVFDFDFLLNDRLQKIRSWAKEYDLENYAYLSFSGGKDSMIVHRLFDMALPENQIPRVFCNTGLEYTLQVKFIRELALNDKRISHIVPRISVRKVLSEYGYPFKSKFHSHMHEVYRRNPTCASVQKYVNRGDHSEWCCPDKLRYQFSPDFKLKLSDKCCHFLKKEPFKLYEKQSGRFISITGMRRAEKGLRNTIACVTSKGRNRISLNPIAPMGDDWCNWFVKTYDIKLSPLYYEPYNFDRVGCIACPFQRHIGRTLHELKELQPKEYDRACNVFGAVYEEYALIGYRSTSFDSNYSNHFRDS